MFIWEFPRLMLILLIWSLIGVDVCDGVIRLVDLLGHETEILSLALTTLVTIGFPLGPNIICFPWYRLWPGIRSVFGDKEGLLP